MSTSIPQQEQSLQAQIAQANEKIVNLEHKLRVLDDALARHLSQQPQFQLLDDICTSLDKLSSMGAANLFWEDTDYDPEKQLQRVRGIVAGFKQKTSVIERLRGEVQADIDAEQAAASPLIYQLAELQEKVESRRGEYELERQARELPYRAMVMPWSKTGEDERRFKKTLAIILFFVIVFGGLAPFLKKPAEENVENVEAVAPERIARFIKKKQEAKQIEQKQLEKLAEKKEEKKTEEKKEKKAEEKIAEKAEEKAPEKPAEKAEEKIAETAPPKETPKPIDTETQKARKTAETKGVLAFKSNLENILKEPSSLKMGTDARISIIANRTNSDALQRSIIVSQATGGSGGINTGALNRQSENSGSQRIAREAIQFTRIENIASLGSAKSNRPDRAINTDTEFSRSDEEIQIVFDRYKAALYRIYNRELRNNPTLRGKMVLRIVIEPDGRVSECTVKSTDLASPALSADIVDRVLKFNFGAKKDVTVITILYPIDFLPAN